MCVGVRESVCMCMYVWCVSVHALRLMAVAESLNACVGRCVCVGSVCVHVCVWWGGVCVCLSVVGNDYML